MELKTIQSHFPLRHVCLTLWKKEIKYQARQDCLLCKNNCSLIIKIYTIHSSCQGSRLEHRNMNGMLTVEHLSTFMLGDVA